MAGWIRVEEDLPEHHKTIKLKKLLGLTTCREAASYALMLFRAAFRHAWRDGDLSAYDDDWIEQKLEWLGDRGALVAALRDCGRKMPDGTQGPGYLVDMRVHGWVERAGKLISDRIYQEQRRASRDADPDERVAALWNSFAEFHKLTPVRLTEPMTGTVPYAELEAALLKATACGFLLGQSPSGWKMNFTWIANAANREKIVSGQYAREAKVKRGREAEAGRDPEKIEEDTQKLLERRRAQAQEA